MIPFSQWFIISLEHTIPNNKPLRLKKEDQWIHIFRFTLLNDPSSFTIPHIDPNSRNYHRLVNIRNDKIHSKKITISFLNSKNKNALSLKCLLQSYRAAFTSHYPIFVKANVHRYILKFNESHKYIKQDYYLILPTNIHFNRKFTLAFCKTLLFKYLDNDLAFFIHKHLKISFKATQTLKGLINNSRKFTKLVDLDNPQIWQNMICPCQLFPNLRNPNTHHICLKAQDLPDSFNNLKLILSLNAKNPVLTNSQIHTSNSISAFLKFFKQFSITPSDIELNRLSDYNNQLHHIRTTSISTILVNRILFPFKDLVFSNLDKNENDWVIICPQVFTKMYYDHFILDGKVYTKSKFSTTQFQNFIKAKALSLDINSIAHLKKSSKTNFAYLVKKSKDLLRVRPIVSYYQNIAKASGKLISRALNVIIKQLSKIWVTMDIHKIDQFIKKMQHINSKNNWSRDMIQGNITFIEFDVKEQYTSLNRPEVIEALTFALSQILIHSKKQFISIHKKKFLKKFDKLGKRNTKDYHIISFEQIMNYAKFEMQTSHFLVGKTLVHQINGLPMGALISAALAVIFCMYKEHISHKTWKQLPFKSIICRYRDDIRMILSSNLSPFQIKKYHQIIQSIYGHDLIIKLENYSHKSCEFVGISILYLIDRFILLYKNKNFTFNNDFSHVELTNNKRRFPDINAEWPSSILCSIIYSSFFQALHISSEPLAFMLSFALLTIEFLSKNYKISWITAAVHKLNITYKTSCINILKWITSRIEFTPQPIIN